jgi:hypothetical protein
VSATYANQAVLHCYMYRLLELNMLCVIGVSKSDPRAEHGEDSVRPTRRRRRRERFNQGSYEARPTRCHGSRVESEGNKPPSLGPSLTAAYVPWQGAQVADTRHHSLILHDLTRYRPAVPRAFDASSCPQASSHSGRRPRRSHLHLLPPHPRHSRLAAPLPAAPPPLDRSTATPQTGASRGDWGNGRGCNAGRVARKATKQQRPSESLGGLIPT